MNVGQLSLFGESAGASVSVRDAANRVGVSVASINNWIREGLLVGTERGHVSDASLTGFIATTLGRGKLTSRANKLNKDSHDHVQLTEQVSVAIKGGRCGDKLAAEYEQSLSESYRNREGIYYTPKAIVDDMFKNIEGDVSDKTFLEPCCGGGQFVVAALERGFRPENIYAFDTDPNAVAITKHRVKELTGTDGCNIVCGDFLMQNMSIGRKFDYVFTNPPWGKKLKKEEKDVWADVYHAGNSTDTCSLFLAAALSLLNKRGVLGFLLPDAFFNVAAFADIRRTVLKYNVMRIADYGKFGALLTKACALVLSNDSAKGNVVCECGNDRFVRKQEDFGALPKNIINYTTDAEDNAVISYLYSMPHITLQGNARWALGIVTGDNKNILKKECGDGCVPIYRGRDITKDGLLKAEYYIDKDLSHCQQVAPMEYYQAQEKIVYRFISDKLVCYLDRHQSYILNSANLFIVNDGFSMSNGQVADMLNSDLMTWLFQHVFGTHKVLRGDLEQLPLFMDYFKEYPQFDEDDLLSYLHITRHNGTYRIKG